MSELADSETTGRTRGLAKFAEVYSFPPGYPEEPLDSFMEATIDELFTRLWSRPGLSTHERRLLTIGILASLGKGDLLRLQFASALDKNEMTQEQIEEIVLHLAYYVGWPLGSVAYQASKSALSKHRDSP